MGSWFHMGIGEALLMMIITIWCGPMVGIQERDGPMLSIMVLHVL